MSNITIHRVSPTDVKIKALVYGSPGAGKTTLAAQANDHPSLAPALFLSFEGGLLSVAGRGDVDEVQIRNMTDLESAYLMLERKQPPFDKYRTVIIDSGSELYNRSLQEAVDGRKKNIDPDSVEIGDYGRAGYQTLRLFRAFRDLPLHVITTSHPRFTYVTGADARTAEPVSVMPSFSPRLATSLMGIFDFVWYMYVFDDVDDQEKSIQRRALLTTKTGAYEAKTRGPNFQQRIGSVVYDPYLPAIYHDLVSSEMGVDANDLTIYDELPSFAPPVNPEPVPELGNGDSSDDNSEPIADWQKELNQGKGETKHEVTFENFLVEQES